MMGQAVGEELPTAVEGSLVQGSSSVAVGYMPVEQAVAVLVTRQAMVELLQPWAYLWLTSGAAPTSSAYTLLVDLPYLTKTSNVSK
jgi:hypothetical protein